MKKILILSLLFAFLLPMISFGQGPPSPFDPPEPSGPECYRDDQCNYPAEICSSAGACIPNSDAGVVDPNESNPGSPGTGRDPDPGSPGTGSGGVTLTNPLKADSLEEFFKAIVDFIVRLGVLVVVVMVVIVGFMFVTARGNPEKISQARAALLWTLVGAVILIGASIIAEAIRATVEAIGA